MQSAQIKPTKGGFLLVKIMKCVRGSVCKTFRLLYLLYIFFAAGVEDWAILFHYIYFNMFFLVFSCKAMFLLLRLLLLFRKQRIATVGFNETR